MIVINRGVRTWTLKDGKDKSGHVVKRTLPPGGSIQCLDESEFKDLVDHKDIVDAAKSLPAVTDKVAALTEERDALKARVADLEDQVAKYEKDHKDGKGKGSK